MTRECPIRFCDGLGVKLPRSTRLQSQPRKLLIFSRVKRISFLFGGFANSIRLTARTRKYRCEWVTKMGERARWRHFICGKQMAQRKNESRVFVARLFYSPNSLVSP